MANDVFANGREISCKAAAGISTASFPDVCMTPPENPATPPGVPVPYPNTGKAKDTTGGSKNVKISGKEVMLKNKSYFKKSIGDEAGSAAKKGIVTNVNRGKVYFTAWSMDVKFEAENVVRHLDRTTHNHACANANEAIPWPFLDSSVATENPCEQEQKKVTDKCSLPIKMEEVCPQPHRKGKDAAQKNECSRALRCRLVPYNKRKKMCCPGHTPDHLIEASAFGKGRAKKKFKNWTYNPRKAPCMCVSGHAAKVSTHGVLSSKRKALIAAFSKREKIKVMTVKQAACIGAATAWHSFRNCSRECLEAQLLDYYKDENQLIEPPAYGPSATTGTIGKRGMVAASAKLAEKLIGLIK